VAALAAFVVVAATIALFELLDRTNFALLSLAAREPPLPVWAGAASAFAATTLIAVALGGIAVAFLAPDLWIVRLAGGILLLAYAGVLVARLGREEGPVARGSSAFAAAFLMIFLLELGDTTMILTIGFVTAYADPLLVGAAALLGLAAVAASSAILGPRIGARVPPRQLERWTIVILVVVGLVTVLYAVDPGAFGAVTTLAAVSPSRS